MLLKLNYKTIIGKKHSGIISVGIFTVWILITELGISALGADLGAFLYVTFHFIINPIFAVVVIIFQFLIFFSKTRFVTKILNVICCFVPAVIIHAAITGNFWLTELLGVNF